jgi:hypothetical protein
MPPKRLTLRASNWYPLAFLTAVGTLVALFLLAAGLPGLKFAPGERFALPAGQEFVSPRPLESLSPDLLRMLGLILVVSIAVSLIIVLSSSRARRQILKSTGKMLLYLAVFGLIFALYNQKQAELASQEEQPTPSAPRVLEAPPPLVEDAPAPVSPPEIQPPSLLSYLVALAVILALGAMGYWLWRTAPRPELTLGEIARSALFDLKSGQAWEDVVIRCYADMSSAASERRNLSRPQAMTPNEYAHRLEQAGLPAGQVQRLTRLFEKARYSSRRSSPEEVQEAVACLSAILESVEARG